MARNFAGGTSGGADSNFINLAAGYLPGSLPISFSFWCNPVIASLGASGGIALAPTNSAVNNSIAIGVKSTGKLFLAKNNVLNIFQTTGTIATGSWSNVVATYDGATWFCYSTGIQETGSNAQTAFVTTSMSIGGQSIRATPTLCFVGSIQDVATWNVILTQAEATGLATGARPNTIRPASLTGYWPLDGLQSPEPDYSGNVFNGTLTGTSLVTGAPVAPFTPRWHRFLGWTPALPAAGLGWIINRRNKLRNNA